jgi:hypothetical protein
MSELIDYNPDLKQRKIGVRESFETGFQKYACFE